MDSTAYIGVGLMCGTSLDGLDMAIVKFTSKNHRWKHSILKTEEVKLPTSMKKQLVDARNIGGLELSLLNNEVGRFIGNQVRTLLDQNKISPDFIASHGITIFHQPENNLTLQIGSGPEIAVRTGVKTICDFRTTDVALNGQGAPLVPFADQELFSDYDFALNLGGFCNLSKNDSITQGFDITVCNMALNNLISEVDLEYDLDGGLASKGKSITMLLTELNNHPYFQKTGPKSIGKEWFENEIKPILERFTQYTLADRLYTLCQHIGCQLGKHLTDSAKTCLVTGGGAHHQTLVKEISAYSNCKLVIPEKELIDSKEAICFAYLGLMRLLEKQNISLHVSGAKLNSSSGAVYLPPLNS